MKRGKLVSQIAKVMRIIPQKVIQRPHCLWELALLINTRASRPCAFRWVFREPYDRASLMNALEEINLFQVAYTTLTELLNSDGRKKDILCDLRM